MREQLTTVVQSNFKASIGVPDETRGQYIHYTLLPRHNTKCPFCLLAPKKWQHQVSVDKLKSKVQGTQWQTTRPMAVKTGSMSSKLLQIITPQLQHKTKINLHYMDVPTFKIKIRIRPGNMSAQSSADEYASSSAFYHNQTGSYYASSPSLASIQCYFKFLFIYFLNNLLLIGGQCFCE